jgi:AraC-like DNA-binding protein
VVLYRDAELRRHQLYACADWSGYTVINTTMQSTKSAGPLAAAWATLHIVGDDGYLDIARRTQHATRRLEDGIAATGGSAETFREVVQILSRVQSTGRARAWALSRLEQPVGLRELAAQEAMSVRTFTRRFREETGMSPQRWLTQQRVERARRLLESTDRPVDAVARELEAGTSLAEAFETLVELQRQGLIRHLGVSNATEEQVTEAGSIAPIVCVQNMYNLAHRHDDKLIDRLATDGIAYVPFFPLGGFTPLQSSALSAVAARLAATPMSVALAWLLQRSPNILLIPGTSSTAHLRENIAGAGLSLSPEDVIELDNVGR